ncbi:hypothetical protein PAHAL_3G451600 [Panicum hallii]|jgi:hypothetical protein|uniref:Uncharacterized protein n=1 Tax=Panicum hallii TaxID=206008 RepID=A0A2S3HEA4_9POAL|nr:hypothetical protein PAHAL_3G451600 [Panicum hallii]
MFGGDKYSEDIQQYRSWMSTWLPGGSPVYIFCLAAVCWAIWKRRNKACFENKKLKHPAEIIIHACALMSYWAGLYGAEMQSKIMEGVKVLLACAHKVLAQQPRPVLYLPAPQEDTSEEENDD